MILIDIYKNNKLIEAHTTDLNHLIEELKATYVWDYLQTSGAEVRIRVV
jgi:hypothetical protein